MLHYLFFYIVVHILFKLFFGRGDIPPLFYLAHDIVYNFCKIYSKSTDL